VPQSEGYLPGTYHAWWRDNSTNAHSDLIAMVVTDVVLCTETCTRARDGECDDGGPGSVSSLCTLGTDCTDCGPR